MMYLRLSLLVFFLLLSSCKAGSFGSSENSNTAVVNPGHIECHKECTREGDLLAVSFICSDGTHAPEIQNGPDFFTLEEGAGIEECQNQLTDTSSDGVIE